MKVVYNFTTMVVEYGPRVCQFHQVTLVAFTETRRCSKDGRNLVKLGSYEVSEYIAHFIQHLYHN